ncbi:hypothetical protein [Virgibacillus sp. SK37]|uniref:hypothetical protein n=1 Tax=Virgibacillus sp. SK37 TaxID=403957 RepID=UPI0004D1B8AB|nr:hypothetical protein [Virgibacillus sp. SK37]AIF45716.1 hypothetical protein X953_19760 [Virgibacillus sp. SK37]
MAMVGSADAGDLVMFTANDEKNTVTYLGEAAGLRMNELDSYSELGRSEHDLFIIWEFPQHWYSYISRTVLLYGRRFATIY